MQQHQHYLRKSCRDAIGTLRNLRKEHQLTLLQQRHCHRASSACRGIQHTADRWQLGHRTLQGTLPPRHSVRWRHTAPGAGRAHQQVADVSILHVYNAIERTQFKSSDPTYFRQLKGAVGSEQRGVALTLVCELHPRWAEVHEERTPASTAHRGGRRRCKGRETRPASTTHLLCTLRGTPQVPVPRQRWQLPRPAAVQQCAWLLVLRRSRPSKLTNTGKQRRVPQT